MDGSMKKIIVSVSATVIAAAVIASAGAIADARARLVALETHREHMSDQLERIEKKLDRLLWQRGH
jgi:prefoldin subunit 5